MRITYSESDYSLDNPEVLQLEGLIGCGFLPGYSIDDEPNFNPDEIICVIHDNPSLEGLHGFIDDKKEPSLCEHYQDALIYLSDDLAHIHPQILTLSRWPVWLQHRVIATEWDDWVDVHDGTNLARDILRALGSLDNLAPEIQMKLVEKNLTKDSRQAVLLELAGRDDLLPEVIAAFYNDPNKYATDRNHGLQNDPLLQAAMEKHIQRCTDVALLDKLNHSLQPNLHYAAHQRLTELFEAESLSLR